jgi:hypothetical protein
LAQGAVHAGIQGIVHCKAGSAADELIIFIDEYVIKNKLVKIRLIERFKEIIVLRDMGEYAFEFIVGDVGDLPGDPCPKMPGFDMAGNLHFLDSISLRIQGQIFP